MAQRTLPSIVCTNCQYLLKRRSKGDGVVVFAIAIQIGRNRIQPADGRCFDTDPESWAFKFCGYDLVQYDYDGLSNTVLAERSPPYVRDAYNDLLYAFTGDRFVSTYLRGPLGVIARTAEKGNADTSDNETHYYLADLMGNHTATARDASEGGDSSPVWQSFDAFGAALGKSGGLAGSLGWRGGEGSVSDRETGLVYMQSRHYDPSLGRFLQSDALPLASLTTQGANRYIYCENDPVNRSDPSGRIAPIAGGLVILLFLIATSFGVGSYFGYSSPSGGNSPAADIGAIIASAAADLIVGAMAESVLGMVFIGLTPQFLLLAGILLAVSFLLGYLFGKILTWLQGCGLSATDAIANSLYPGIARLPANDADSLRLALFLSPSDRRSPARFLRIGIASLAHLLELRQANG